MSVSIELCLPVKTWTPICLINQIKVEWEEAKNIKDNDLEDCICTIIHQFGIPCRHRLASICLSSTNAIPIPINLLHPRWKIDEDPMVTSAKSWVMPSSITIFNEDLVLPDIPRLQQHDRYYHNGQNLLLKSLQDVEQLHAEVAGQNAEAAGLIAHRVHEWANALREEFGQNYTTSQPIGSASGGQR